MHNRYDQFAKNLLRDALTQAGEAETEVEVISPTQKIDIYCVPDPRRKSERLRLGELGQLASEPSLFEPFSATPGIQQVRECLRKQLNWHHELERRAEAEARAASAMNDVGDSDKQDKPRVPTPFPRLVIISRGRPETALSELGCLESRPGVYTAVRGLELNIVVLSELPRIRETLLLRLLSSGWVLSQALDDFSRLPDDAWEKSIATPLLLHFHFEIREPEANEEDGMSPEIQAWYEEYQEKQRQLRVEALKVGLEEGREEGREEGARRVLLRQLRVRFGDLPQVILDRIESADAETLELWGERMLFARSLDQVWSQKS